MTARILVLCACFLAGSVFLALASRPGVVPSRELLATLPLMIGGWQGQAAEDFSDQVMSVLGVDDYANRLYVAADGSVLGLYIGYYQNQRQGDAIHSPLNCLPGSGWDPIKREFRAIPIGNKTIVVNRIAILKGLDKQVVLYWYQSHGRVVASEYSAKLYAVLDAIRTGRTDAALVRIVCPVASLEPAAEEAAGRRAAEFAQLLFPMLSRYIPD